MLSKKIPKRSGIKGDKKSQKNKDRDSNGLGGKIEHKRIKEKVQHKNSGRGTLLIPEFMNWIKDRNGDKGLEIHHFYGNGGGGKMDCFITVISHELHYSIHHGANDMGVQKYIEHIGERKLILKSMQMMIEWLQDDLTEYRFIETYRGLIHQIMTNTDNAIEIVKNFDKVS